MSGLSAAEHSKADRMAGVPVARAGHLKRGIYLEYLTIGWNLLEGAVAIACGSFAGSVALIGFGFDSLIETSSGGILLWRLRAERSGQEIERLERRALRLVGTSFILLAAYVTFGSVRTLLARQKPEQSDIGIALATLSLIVMPVLARFKRKTAARLDSAALRADSRQSSICAYLSVILLGGLGLNTLFGWWWSDSLAALVMVPIIIKEGIDGLRGEVCVDCH
jgi:divalent metal cation (Fe/Co/Zn/Cd) transporter